MIRVFIIISFLFFNGCSTFKKDVVECPKLIAPKKAAEIVVNSESNSLVYLGFRGVQKSCFKDGDDIQMELSVNIRAIRNDTTEEDYVPVNIIVVSLDLNEKEFIQLQKIIIKEKEELTKLDKSISGFNLGANIGEDSGQTIFHCHIHLIPRRKGDSNNPRGGIRGVIPNKQNY